MKPTQKEDGSKRPRSLEARIYAIYSDLPPAEKRLADVLLQYQMDLPSYTAGELAEKAQVSKATAARLIRTLGYKTYPDAKRQIRKDQDWGSPQAGLADKEGLQSQSVSIARTMQMDLDNIRTTVEGLPEKTLADVSDAIVRARRVWIMGLRSGYGLAQQAAHYFTLMKSDVQVLPAGGASYSHEIASIAKGDVMLVIAFRRRPRLLPTIIREARAAGAITILITDLSALASAKAANHVLRCRCQSPSPFNSFVAALTIINYLAWNVATVMGAESLARYEKIDRLVKLLDDVSTPQTTTGR
ncbi:MurR/RpiR family transcriptional regulator [Rhizobium sp. CF142]|uniref:MurR/RpiR family transcriptional regulator n=1 Tax=Rhizobium sp. CF142 TaxID=1144314 RepID=UPI00026EF5B2|nr:MurR/RpiR family transcriptional regulator [Rhizobium sp. CF142]EJJ31448.1 transcriptional regulator [Rhizobium sp. CF142]